MKKPRSGTIALLFLSHALRTAVLTEAARERITLEEGGIRFRIDRFDDGRSKPYGVRFSTSTVGRSRFRFDASGQVTYIMADTERYVVRYTSEGSLRRVLRKDSRRRALLDEGEREHYLEQIGEEGVVAFAEDQQSYSCDDCEETWDVLCGKGISTVCDLYDHPSLGTAGASSVMIMCDTIESTCASLPGVAACEGQCVNDACSPNPCLNGGSCAVDEGGGHICSCSSGFGGMACQVSTTSLAEFRIELDYLGTWTDARKAVFESAASRWAEVVTHVPCGGTSAFPAGRLLISASIIPIDGLGKTLGQAQTGYIWNNCPVGRRTIPLTGSMAFDIDDIGPMESTGVFEGVVLHEMGHVIGVGSTWEDCSTCVTNGDPDWKCPAVVAVYNDLKGDPDGTDADVIELDGGLGTRCFHFDEVKFGDELMTGEVEYGGMPLSKMTAASLEDTGYIVDPSMVDAYTLPARRMASLDTDLEQPFVFQETAVKTTIYLIDEESGQVTGEIEGFAMHF